MIDEPLRTEIDALTTLADETGFFTVVEIGVIREMLAEYFEGTPGEDPYHFRVYRDTEGGPALGFVAYGHIPMTEGAFDLYWIVVGRDQQNKGIGRKLLTATEENVAQLDGRVLYVETSDTEQYAPTRAFYDRTGYARAAHFPDFYRPGDGKVVFSKFLTPG